MFFKHFKAIMQIKILLHEGRGGEISSYLTSAKVFYMRGNASAVAAKYKNATLLTALKRVAAIELAMKGAAETGTAETNIEIERFMQEFFL